MTTAFDATPIEASRLSLTLDCSADHTALIRLCGELDLASGHLIEDVFPLVQRRTSGPVTIDAAELAFCDASGLGRIVALRRLLRRHGRELAVRSPSPQLRRVLGLARLSELIEPSAAPSDPGALRAV
jgi:anti-anti-sigma factor